jgi:hypothetical protein
MKTGPAVLLSLVVGALGGFLVGQRQAGGKGLPPPPPPPSTLPAAMCEATVKLSLQPPSTPGGKKTIVADPAHAVCLARNRPLTWDIDGAGEVSIVFEEKDIQGVKVKGPFPAAGDQYNMNRGEYVRQRTASLKKMKTKDVENKPELDGQWKYTVTWKPGATPAPDDPDPLDPAVCIRD